MTDYRKLRPDNITSPEFRHLFLLIYWAVFGIVFLILELSVNRNYMPMVSSLDDKIPFCEFFIFPYLLWFVLLFGIHIYTVLFDIPSFKKLMYFIIITYTVTALIYIFFPNKQELRPIEFERDNFCVDIVKRFYAFDTNTNVCPSLHVVGSFAVLFTAWNSKGLNTFPIRAVLTVLTVLVSISTVFLKQHSIIDVIVALVLVFAALPFAYILPDKIKLHRKTE